MRHIRSRRKYKVILLLLLALCCMLLVESRIEALVPEIKTYAETTAEKALGGRFGLSIGSVDGGVLQPIVLNDVRIKQIKGSALFQYLKIDNIRINYRIWDLLRMKNAPEVSEILAKNSTVYVNFSVRNGDITGFVGIEGGLADSKVSGYVWLFGKHKVEFTGSVKGDEFNILIRPRAGTLRLAGSISDAGDLTVDFKADHLKFRNLDVVASGRARNRFIANGPDLKNGALKGELDTRELAINYKMFPGIKASYAVSDGRLDIADLAIGESIRISGKLGLKRPNVVDLTALVNNASLTKLFGQFGLKETSSVLSGTMNGKFTFKGPMNKLRVESGFDIRKGTMATLDFDYLSASLKGDMPYLKIEYARVTRQSGYFAISGEFDMTRIGKDSFFSDIKLITDDGAITWDAWGGVRGRDSTEINMTKSLTSDIDVRYKKFISDEKIDESVRDTDQMRLEYKLSPNESLGMMVGPDQDFVGFEHRDKF